MKKKKKDNPQFFKFFLIFLGVLLVVGFSFEKNSHSTKKNVLAVAIVNCTVDPAKVAINADEQAFLGLINAYRQQNNAGPLKLSNTLTQAAAWMANDSAVRNVLSHTDSLGRLPVTRIPNCGYVPPANANYETGENVADGTPTENANQVFTAWKNSPEHNANMLNPAFVVIGIGKDTNNGDYWVNDFGSYDDTTAITPTSPFVTITPLLTNPSGTGISLTVCPHGLGKCGDNANTTGMGNINPKHTNRFVSLTLFNAANQPTATQTGTLTYNTTAQNFQGSIPITAIATGQYLTKIKLDGYLLQQLPGILSITQGQPVTVPSVSLVVGDTNNDNKIDLTDYNNIISCYGTKQTSTTCQYAPTATSARADINDDGVIDGGDFNLFLRELSVQKGN